MGFSLSPAVLVSEKDLTGIIPAVSTSAGAFAGTFSWGPVLDPVIVSSEESLVRAFGTPNSSNFKSFFTAADFLAYSANLLVNRLDIAGQLNACSIPGGTPSLKINNNEDFLGNHDNVTAAFGEFAARFPGAKGNGILVSYADSASFATWTYKNLFSVAPGTSDEAATLGGADDELHVVVIDSLGKFTGTPGEVLDKYEFLSKSKDAKRADGTTAYYKAAINSNSKYIWVISVPTGWGATLSVDYTTVTTAYSSQLSGGSDATTAATQGEKQAGFNMFANDELYDISLIPTGDASPALAAHIIQNVTEVRRDAIAFISPYNTTTSEPIIGYGDDGAQDAKTYIEAVNASSSYGFCDDGYYYRYDQYNDTYRYVPLNGGTAGLCARTDFTNEPWFSPAGLNRGQYKNVLKLAYNPGKTERDTLYQANINPVINMPGNGFVLFGDKTMLKKPSAFDRINVRRLFIVLEKAIATAAKYQLFELNDEFTRAQFKNLVEPFLRDVQGRRGVTDFRVVCDERNNTGEVIDRNEFVADIYIKPAKSINVIKLNFIATRTSVSFSEVGG